MLRRIILLALAIFVLSGAALLASLPRERAEPVQPKPSLEQLLATSPSLSQSDLDEHCHVDSIALKRDVCFGSCPIYSVTFFKTGRAEYFGEAYVDHVGNFEGSISLRDFGRLCQLVESASFENLKAEYMGGGWSDGPWTYVDVVQRGKMKKVSDYDETGPADLWALEHAIDAVARRADWKSKDSSVGDSGH